MKIQSIVTIILGTAGLLAMGTVVPGSYAQSSGQDQSTPPAAMQQGPGMHGHHDPYADLNLSDDQKAQIKKIHTEAKAKADAVMADSSLSDADKKAKIREIHHAAMMESDKVLTPEQREQMKEKMREHKAAKSPEKPS